MTFARLKSGFVLAVFALAVSSCASGQDEPMQPPRSSQVPRPPASSTTPNSVPKPPGASDSQSPAEQAEPSNDDGVFVFRKQVQEVILHATVVDSERRMVTSLGKANFTVYEDGKPQMITAFRREDVPVSIGIVVDNSGSMQEKRSKVNQAVVNLVRESNPEDEVFVVNFGEDLLPRSGLHFRRQPGSGRATAKPNEGKDGSLRRDRGIRRPSQGQRAPGKKGIAGYHRRPGQRQPGNVTGSCLPPATTERANPLRHRNCGG